MLVWWRFVGLWGFKKGIMIKCESLVYLGVVGVVYECFLEFIDIKLIIF